MKECYVPDGWLYDFGVNTAGVCRLKIKGECGQKIAVRHGENLRKGFFHIGSTITVKPDTPKLIDFFQRDVYYLKGGEEEKAPSVGIWGLIIQGVATSIDALSVGFTISEYGFFMALACVVIIAIVTFIICMVGIRIGKCCGTRLAGKATIFGGIILILIGIEIWITGVF